MSKKKKAKLTNPRNTIAVAAKFRNSAGSMGNKPEVVDAEEMKPLHCAKPETGCRNDEFDAFGDNEDRFCWCECNVCAGIED